MPRRNPPPRPAPKTNGAPRSSDLPREGGFHRLRELPRRIGEALQVEDWALFAWLLLLETGLEHGVGRSLRDFAAGGSAPVWILLATGFCFAVVFYTRGPEDVDVNAATSRRCVLSVVLFFAAKRYLAGESSWMGLVVAWGLLVVVAMAPLQSLERLPYTGLALRRVLVMPAILLGNTVFVAEIGPRFLADPAFESLDPTLRLPAKIGLAGLLFLYTVVGPRAMAGGPWNPFFWTLRFAWYLVAERLSGRLLG